MSYGFINCLITLQDGHSVLLINQKYMYENINFPFLDQTLTLFVFNSVKNVSFYQLSFPIFRFFANFEIFGTLKIRYLE